MHKKEIIAITAFLLLVISTGIFYFNNYPAVTGAAINENEKETNFYGTYSIKPSFKVNIDYDLEDYNKIIKSLNEISKCTKDGTTIEKCMENTEKTTPDYEWELNCDKGPEKVFYDFAEFYQGCFDSEDNNCICRLDLDYSEEEIKQYNLAGGYKIKSKQDINNNIIALELEEQQIDLKYNIKTNKIKNWNPIEYSIDYQEKKKESAILKFRIELTGDSYDIKYPDEIILYKFNDRSKDKKQNEMEFIKLENNKAIFPNKEEKELENLKECTIKKNIHKFCVTNKKKQFYVFDKIKNKPELKNPIIKFAAYIEDLPPQVVEDINVKDKLIDDKSVMLKWDKSKAEDVVKYNVYYAKSSLNLFEENKSLTEIKKTEGFNQKTLSLENIKQIKIPSLILDNCNFDFDKKSCIYATGEETGIILEKEKIYLFKDALSKEFYIYALSVEDNIDYDFSITSVDKNGNEIDNIQEKQELPIIKNKKSIDDLTISSKDLMPSVNYLPSYNQFSFSYLLKTSYNNIDGTDADDFVNYTIYYHKESTPNLDELNNLAKTLPDKPLNELLYFDSFKPNPSNGIYTSTKKIIPNSKETFFFMVIAMDKNGNPKQNIKPKEVGIETTLHYAGG